jgi:hypothetical protein
MKTQTKSKPSDGKKLRLIRAMSGMYALNVKQIARLMRLQLRQTQYYVAVLRKEGKLYVRYKQDRFNYYALRRGK